MDNLISASLFLGLKFVGYVAWCFLGLRWLGPAGGASAKRALALALLRQGIGVGLGFALAGVLGFFGGGPHQRLGFDPVHFAASLTVLRWLEWSLIATMIRRSGKAGFLLGAGARDRWWRLGGVAISFATDLASLLGIGGLGLIPC